MNLTSKELMKSGKMNVVNVVDAVEIIITTSAEVINLIVDTTDATIPMVALKVMMKQVKITMASRISKGSIAPRPEDKINVLRPMWFTFSLDVAAVRAVRKASSAVAVTTTVEAVKTLAHKTLALAKTQTRLK